MADKRYTPDVIARAEALVSKIQGISSCRIAADETGEITEVHVVATSQKPPKLVARDVETCLKAELGIHVDYKKIGVVLFDAHHPEDHAVQEPSVEVVDDTIREFPIEEHLSRFTFQSVNLFTSQESIQAEVELSRDGIDTFGSSKTENLSLSPLVVVAEATLKAVSELLDDNMRLCLADLLEIPTGEDTVIIVKVDLVKKRETKALAGCSLDAGNANQTVVFATLDAINRVVGKVKSKSSMEYKIR